MTAIVVIDIGSNSIHFMVAAIETSGTLHELARHREAVRLGASTASYGKIDEVSWRTALEVVERCCQLAARWTPAATLITATSAVRDARNGPEFLRAVAKVSGVEPRLLSGEDEAVLTGLALACSSARNYPRFLNIDIGGGSLELGLFERTKPLLTASLPLGSVRLTTQHVHHAPIEPAELEALSHAIDIELMPALPRFCAQELPPAFASSGTAIGLGHLLALQRGDYDYYAGYTPQYQELRIDIEALCELNIKLQKMTIEERVTLGVLPSRADTIIAGGLLLERIMLGMNLSHLQAAAWALREGVLLEWLRAHYPDNPLVSWSTGTVTAEQLHHARGDAVWALGRRYKFEPRHSAHVAKLAVRLFEQLMPVHRLGEQEKEWLEYAGLLHDIGYSIGHSAHHKHSLYLIKHSELPGFSPEEIAVIALVSRYHRKALPNMRHLDFAMLSPETRDVVVKLAALLRIADALDRSHAQRVHEVTTELRNGKIVLEAKARGNCTLEQWVVAEKQELFTRAFGITPVFRWLMTEEG